MDVRGRSGPCALESYASVEYVTARSSEINNNNLQREDTTGKFSTFRVVEASGEPSQIPFAVTPGAAQCDLCFRKFPKFADVFAHKARPCVDDTATETSRVVRVVFPQQELPFIADALQALGKDVSEYHSSSLAGAREFSVEEEVDLVPLLLRRLYVAHVTKLDVEEWYPSMTPGVTQRSFFVPLSDAELKLIQSLASSHLAENLGMSRRLTNAELEGRELLEDKLQAAIDSASGDFPGGDFFVRLSTRSPKDAVSLTKEQKESFSPSEKLRAKLQLMKCRTGTDVLSLLTRSQRIFTDISMHFQYRIPGATGNTLSVIFREFSEKMAPDHEFRCYVVGRRLRAISQYHCYFRLEDDNPLFRPEHSARVRDAIVEFHDATFSKLLPDSLRDYVVDIAIDRENPSPATCSVVELNPHGPSMSSGSALFNWAVDEALLCGFADNPEIVPIRVLRKLEDDESERQS